MEQSLQKQLDQIRTGLQVMMNPKNTPPAPVEIANPVYYWVNDIYDAFAIVEASGLGKFYKVEYSWDADGKLSFGDPVEVEKDWKPVGTVKCLWTIGDESPLTPLLRSAEDGQDLEDVLVGFGGSVKALPTGEVEGCLVRFSNEHDTDLQGDFFAKDTDYGDHKEIDIMYHHGQDPKLGSRVIGKGILTTDDVGVWIKGQLFLRDKYEKAVLKLAQMGKLGWSAGTAEHLFKSVRVGKANKITCFRLGLDATMATMPIEPRNGVVSIKSFSIPAEELTEAAVSASAKAVPPPTSPGGGGLSMKKEENEMTPEEIAKMIADGIAANEAANAKKAADQAAIDKLVEEKVAAGMKEKEAEFLKSHRLPFGMPAVTHLAENGKFDSLEPKDMAVLVGILNAAKAANLSSGPSDAALKCLAIRLEEDKSDYGEFGRRAMKSAGIKADELNNTAQSGYGSDWIGAAYSQAIWEAIRVGDVVLQKLMPYAMEIPQGYSSDTIPLEGADPTFYKVAETTADDDTTLSPATSITSSKMGTEKKQITIAKMGARTMYSGEMEEDSLVMFASQLRRQMELAGIEQLVHAIIDGDITTTGSTNINDIGNGSAQTATNLYLLFNGFRKSALVTTTANSRSASGGLTVDDYLETAKLMGAAGINALDVTKVGFLIDANAYWKTIALPEVKTRDVSAAPTIENGRLTGLWGYSLDKSAFMHYKSAARKANTAGKVDQTTPANNTTGAILAVRWDQWKLAWKRRMTMEVTRIPRADASEIVALMRVGLGQRDTEASAITYNVGV